MFYLLNDQKTDFEQIFVAGGAMVYDTLIDYCDEAIITWVNKIIPEGNKKFPIDKYLLTLKFRMPGLSKPVKQASSIQLIIIYEKIILKLRQMKCEENECGKETDYDY